MTRDIIADVKAGEIRLAVVEDEKLVEFHIERTGQKELVGNIYRAKVSRVLPGLHSAFIDVGLERNAYLYLNDAIPGLHDMDMEESEYQTTNKKHIQDAVKAGQEITVQVIKEPFDKKGPRVTTHLSIPGRYMVYIPDADYIGVSKKIRDDSERTRLKEIAKQIKTKHTGLIIRTAGEGKQATELEQDYLFLQGLWEKIKKREKKGKVPRCIYEEPCLVEKAARDMFTKDTNKFVINDKNYCDRVLDMLDILYPTLKHKIEYFYKDYEIFPYYHLESQLKEALSKKVMLKSGGSIIIEKTEALTVVDVNTGKFTGRKVVEDTFYKTNIEAAKEIIRQIRLRDIGGIIIIDFIDMESNEHKEELLKVLKEAIKSDRTKIQLHGMTELGLAQITRKKVHKSLSAMMTHTCSHCGGTGRVSINE